MFIDTHAHLNFKAFNNKLDNVIDKSKLAGIGKIIIPGAKINSSIKAIEIACEHTGCFAAIGIHPHHADEYKTEEIINKLKILLKNKKIVAIGEIGLDYHVYRDYPPLAANQIDKQKRIFDSQISLGIQNNLPLIIHSRDSVEEVTGIIKSFNTKTNSVLRGVFHCFSGNILQLKSILALGFYIGLDGNVTYDNNSGFHQMIRTIPLSRLLLETDSPYLTPEPLRGEINTPSNIPIIAEKVAQIKNISVGELENITTRNAISLFKI